MQRPTNLSNIRQYNVDDIDLSPLSPLQDQQQQHRVRHFQPGMLFSRETFERIHAQVNHTPCNASMFEESNGDSNDNETHLSNVNLLNDEMLERLRQEEIDQLSHIIVNTQPKDDSLADAIMERLNLIIEQTKSMNDNNNEEEEIIVSSSSSNNPYPPVNQSGVVSDHDRPYAEYGHLDRQTIAQELQLDLQPPTTLTTMTTTTTTTTAAAAASVQQFRFHAKSFAITAWTEIPKETVMDAIKEEFGINNIQYICISEEISELNHRRHLHIQIILREKIDRRKPFLDQITQTHCNYQVTRNDLAWNEYIKKGGNYIEFNTFKSTTVRGQKQWPTVVPSTVTDQNTTMAAAAVVMSRTTTMTTTVRAQTAQRRQYEIETVRQAFILARTDIDQAMDLIEQTFPLKFVTHSSWYLSTFNYIRLRAQIEADRQGDLNKEYIWPYSFPECTPRLRDAMNRWIQHHFSRTKHAKCLIIIGPTNTGKTSFALSLPGRVNYFKGRWNLDQWNDYARYSVYDGIPWDQFQHLNYPNKKDLLTQNGKTNATDKYRGTKEINVQQPAIVLLNPEDAGSLLQQQSTTNEAQQNIADYWKKRAFIYIMGSDEYFHRHRPQTRATSTNTSNSSMSPNDERMGDSNEFERMYQRYHEKKHSK